MSGSTNSRSSTSSGAMWFTTILIALVLYVLSIAPVMKLLVHIHGRNPPAHVVQAVRVIYAPIIALRNSHNSVEIFYDWYFDLWDAPH